MKLWTTKQLFLACCASSFIGTFGGRMILWMIGVEK